MLQLKNSPSITQVRQKYIDKVRKEDREQLFHRYREHAAIHKNINSVANPNVFNAGYPGYPSNVQCQQFPFQLYPPQFWVQLQQIYYPTHIQNITNCLPPPLAQLPVPQLDNVYFQKQEFVVFRKKLGEGTYSKVWEGINLKTNQKIAAKQVDKIQINEIKCLKSLKSAHIVDIFKIFRHQKSHFIILQYCEKNLRTQLQQCNYNVSKVLKYFEQIVTGMEVLNKNNILHRDLKFENILIKDNCVKIADFGLAKFMGDELEVQSRRCGTPYTMAPEILIPSYKIVPYTIKCDIYAIGVILHEMLYQKHPYDLSLIKLRRQQRVEIDKKYGILDRIIDECLLINPNERIDWQSFKELYQRYLSEKQYFFNQFQHYDIEVQKRFIMKKKPRIEVINKQPKLQELQRRNNALLAQEKSKVNHSPKATKINDQSNLQIANNLLKTPKKDKMKVEHQAITRQQQPLKHKNQPQKHETTCKKKQSSKLDKFQPERQSKIPIPAPFYVQNEKPASKLKLKNQNPLSTSRYIMQICILCIILALILTY